jgi:hypothetical protein
VTDAPKLAVTPEVVAALAHVKRCNDLLSGRCAHCDELQRFWATARAIVDGSCPMGHTSPIGETRAPAAPQARLAK